MGQAFYTFILPGKQLPAAAIVLAVARLISRPERGAGTGFMALGSAGRLMLFKCAVPGTAGLSNRVTVVVVDKVCVQTAASIATVSRPVAVVRKLYILLFPPFRMGGGIPSLASAAAVVGRGAVIATAIVAAVALGTVEIVPAHAGVITPVAALPVICRVYAAALLVAANITLPVSVAVITIVQVHDMHIKSLSSLLLIKRSCKTASSILHFLKGHVHPYLHTI